MITKMCKFCTYSCCENMLWMLNKLRGTSASWKLDSKSQLSSVAHGDAHSYWAFWMVLECVCVGSTETLSLSSELSAEQWTNWGEKFSVFGVRFHFKMTNLCRKMKNVERSEWREDVAMQQLKRTNDCSNSSFQDPTFLYKCSFCLFLGMFFMYMCAECAHLF